MRKNAKTKEIYKRKQKEKHKQKIRTKMKNEEQYTKWQGEEDHRWGEKNNHTTRIHREIEEQIVKQRNPENTT